MNSITLNVPQAHEARRIVDEGQYQKALEQAKQVQQLINDAIGQGKKYITFDGNLELPVVQNLRAKGYEVTSGSHYNEQYWSISW